MDKKNNNTDEEYTFQDSTESTSFSGNAHHKNPASTFFEKTKRHHIFLILFTLMASIGIYKVVSKLMQRVYASKSVASTKIQKPTVPAIPTAVQANNVLINRLNHLEQAQQESQSHIQDVDSELNEVKSNLADYNARLMGIDEQTQRLQTRQEAFLQKQQKAEMKRIQEKKLAPKPIYYVRAIIPGRVWLNLQDGSTLTLGLGDKLTGYGVITAIDPNQGTITLSSGAVIGYNPDDR